MRGEGSWEAGGGGSQTGRVRGGIEMRGWAVVLGVMAGMVVGSVSPAGAQEEVARAIEAARAGGVTLVCRHAITDSSHREQEPVDYDDPATQRRLSPEGERQSRSLGEAFRALRIPVDDVIASPMQRARRTAELMFGRATIDSTWHTNGSDYGGPPLEARRRMLRSPPATVRLIVSHIGTMGSVLDGIEHRVAEGDCVVLRPTSDGFTIVGVVPWRSWLLAADPT